MKKAFLFAAVALMAAGTASAQRGAHKTKPAGNITEVPTRQTAPSMAAPEASPALTTAAVATPGPTTSLTLDNIAFVADKHDFGTLREGDPAEYTFTVKNTGKEDLVITNVQPSCGCTAADYTKEPIKPGKTGMVKASYGTNGRPGVFNKTLTVMTNAGSKMLYISGNVEKAPESSAPQNSSMIRTN